MIELVQLSDYVTMLIIAAALGSVGGLGFELLQTRRVATVVAVAGAAVAAGAPAGGDATESGVVQTLRWVSKKEGLYDLGFAASMVIGAIASVAALYFFPPQVTIEVTAATGATETNTEYDLIKLVALSLIVGSAGPSFLTSMQSRLSAVLSQQQAAATANASSQQLAEVKTAAKGEMKEAVEAAVKALRSDISGPIETAAHGDPKDAKATAQVASSELNEMITRVTDEATKQFDERIDKRIDEADKTVKAVLA